MTVEIKGAFYNGVQSINRGLSGLARDSEAIASAPVQGNPGDLQDPLLNMIGDRQQVEAGTKVVKTADEMLGSLFDATA